MLGRGRWPYGTLPDVVAEWELGGGPREVLCYFGCVLR